jgi:predicted aldo/keto reductase-like oxidoreductase
LGLRWVGDQQEVAVVLSGVSTMEQLKENIAVFQDPLVGSITQQEAEIVAKIKRLYDEKIEVGCTACGYCMPCPAAVNIPHIFRLYNNVSIGGSLNTFRRPYSSWMKDKTDASQCTECGQCEEVCPQNLPIIEQLKKAHTMLAKCNKIT